MAMDLDALKKRLSELAPIVNQFKSDAVQLKVIEYLLSAANIGDIHHTDNAASRVAADIRPSKAAVKAKKKQAGKRKVTGGSGAKATVSAIYEAGFFGEPRTIKDIIDHCETKMAKRIKQNEISGKLASMVRSGELSRSKNSDGQYAYKQPDR